MVRLWHWVYGEGRVVASYVWAALRAGWMYAVVFSLLSVATGRFAYLGLALAIIVFIGVRSYWRVRRASKSAQS